jgi:hypothetical protein
MAVSNTNILIKRSSSTSTPSSLKAGEIAYSYQSNNFFIGTADGTGALPLGGYNTYTAVNNATASNTASTIVKRDANGAFAGRLYGDANTADTLATSQNFSITGGDITASAVGFNGSSAVTLNASLNTISGLTAGTYGSATLIPILTVAANGRVVAISNASGSISATSNFVVAGNTGSSTFYTGNTFHIVGQTNSGISTTETVIGNDAYINVGIDNTIARTNTSAVGTQVFSTDINIPNNNLTVGGTLTTANLYVSGNLIVTNATQTLNVQDPIIYLAANNNGNVVDIGLVGHFVGAGHSGDTSHYQHTGFVRDYADNKWKLFSNVTTEPTSTVNFGEANTVYDTIKIGGADLSFGNVSNVSTLAANTLTLTNALTVPNGGTGATTFTTGGIVIGQGTGALSTLANSSFTATGSGAQNNTVTSISVDAYGRTTAATYQAISGLTVPQGGTGASSFTSGGLVIGSGTGALTTLANTTYTLTGALQSNNSIQSLTVDAYGRLTAVTGAAISGLTVSQGGTGLSSVTTNGITYGNGTGAVGVTAAAGASDQTWSNQILTVTNAGVPVWSSAMDGGTF